MQYALLIHEKPDAYAGLTEAQRRAITDEYLHLQQDPRILGGVRLKPAELATTVRVVDGESLITDGPFADTKEVFGGYYILESDDVDAAFEIARQIPAARMGGSVEIRPVLFAMEGRAV